MDLAFDLQKGKPLRDDNAPVRGYRMITCFDIENFRCFPRLRLQDLRTINVIVGDNGSGKTALLEAFLLSADPHPESLSLIRATRRRPFPQEPTNWSRLLFQSLWDDLFFNFHDSKTIRIEFKDSLYNSVGVEISYVWFDLATVGSGGPIPRLVMERFYGDNPDWDERTKLVTSLRINEQGHSTIEGPPLPMPPVYVLPSTVQFLPDDLVRQYGDLSKQNLEDHVVETLRKDFPELSNIQILPDAGTSGLFVKIESIPNKKMPLASVSAGAARYLNLVMGVISTHTGIVLVDEIENGIYWKKMPFIWQRLRELCIEQGVQLFATTHSYECLQALIGAVQGHEKDFSLIRTEIRDDKHIVKQFDGESFLAALEQHGEIR